MGMKIAVAIVTNRQIRPKTVLSLMDMMAHTEHEIVPIVATEGFTIAENRSYCTVQALNQKCDYLLFVDDDMIFPPDTIEKLLANNKPIVGVASNSRMIPLRPTVALMGDNGEPVVVEKPEDIPKEPFKCYSIGMGVALIDLTIFNDLPKPWYKFTENGMGKVVIGEDEWFCNQAKVKGYEIWCDPTLEIGHIGDFTY